MMDLYHHAPAINVDTMGKFQQQQKMVMSLNQYEVMIITYPPSVNVKLKKAMKM